MNTISTYYPFSLIFLFYGFELLTTSKNHDGYAKKLVLLLPKLVTLASLINFYYITTVTLVHPVNKSAICFSLSLQVKVLVVLIQVVYLTFKISSVSSLLSRLSHSLTDTEKKRVLYLNRVCVVIWFVFVIINASVQLTTDLKLIVFIIWWAIPCFGLIVGTPLLLIIVCYCVHLLEKRFQSVVNQMHDSNHINYDNLLTDILFVQSLKESINSVFGLFPFLWFCELFSSTCFRLTLWTINNSLDSSGYDFELYQGYVEFFQIYLLDLLYLFAVNYFESHKMSINQLFVLLSQDKRCLSPSESNSKNILVNQIIYCYSSTKYKAFNVFTIDNKFLFSFLGFVVSFTVMLIQFLH